MTRLILAAAAALLLILTTNLAHAADKWDVVEQGTMCRLQTGSPSTGVIALTFRSDKPLALQLFKDKFIFHGLRANSLAGAPYLAKMKAHLIGNNDRNDHGEQGPLRSWNWWVTGFAETNFNIVFGQGSLDMPVQYMNVVYGLKYASQINVEFVDGGPTQWFTTTWSATTPDKNTYDKWDDCVTRVNGKTL